MDLSRRNPLAIGSFAVACLLLAGCESSRSEQSKGEETRQPPSEDVATDLLGKDVARFHVPLVGDEPQRGPDDALVTVVELGDFECPYCARIAPTLKRLEAVYGDDLRIVWMNNPLPFHPNAKAAATAALEAHAQKGNDGFWGMHDRLFANQRALSGEYLQTAARELELDLEAFRAAIAEDAHAGTIARQQSLADRLNAKGTPHFFINGRRLRGAQPLTRFAMLIDEELRRAKALVKAGVPKSELYAISIENGTREVEAPPTPTAPAPTPSRVYDIPLPDEPRAKGPADAEVVIQEFSDFQCPVCRRVLPTLEKVRKEYGPKVRIVYRDYPLDFHPDAHLAAQAAREVFEQRGNDAFWNYHDILLQNQHALARTDLEKYAKRIRGIDMQRFRLALDSGKHASDVDADMKAVARAGARIGTPAFFINGKLAIQGAYPFETFRAAIDAELNGHDRP